MTNADRHAGHAALMDSNYRLQRHIYDLTRKHYLLGRDRLIEELDVPAGGSVLEVGCGTGRNLVKIANRYPNARLFGLDISTQMLETAETSLRRGGVAGRVLLRQGDAAAFEPEALFGEAGFDRVVLSYALSMIPAWPAALACALASLRPVGSLRIVDFGQQERLPGWFAAALRTWLARFHVTPRANLGDRLGLLADAAARPLSCESLYRGYAWSAVVGPSTTRQSSAAANAATIA